MKEIKIKGLNEIVYSTTLDNGLKVHMWQKEDVHSFYSTYMINYGSINTDFKIGKKEYHTPPGIAHYLEHIKFNINPDLTAHEMFAELGCETNAFTSFNVTNSLYTLIIGFSPLIKCTSDAPTSSAFFKMAFTSIIIISSWQYFVFNRIVISYLTLLMLYHHLKFF